MKSTIAVTLAAFAAGAIAQDCGSAHVINSCDYDVYLTNVPAAGGGFDQHNKTLSANGGTYEQIWTELGNQQGWSIKLSKSESLESIMQYEYTYHQDGIIWYDLSDVNGNPWDGNWEITADGDCTPKQQAYMYSTDDAYGMQACKSSSSITVRLCSGDNAGGSDSGSSGSSDAPAPYSAPASSAPAYTPSSTPEASPTSYAAPTTPTSEAAPASTKQPWGYSNGHWEQANEAASPTNGNERVASPVTTLATAVTSSPASIPNAEVVIVTETQIAYTTVDTYVKRDNHHHAHHPRHPHGRRL